jgi:hypothetical protein
MNKEIIWKRNNSGGKNAYVGEIRIGDYYYNGIDSKNGKYKVNSLLPQSTLIGHKVDSDTEAMKLIETEFNLFMKKLGIDN